MIVMRRVDGFVDDVPGMDAAFVAADDGLDVGGEESDGVLGSDGGVEPGGIVLVPAEIVAAGGDVMGCDWRINIDQAWMDISYRSAIQGNLDPVALFAPLPELRNKVHDLLRRTGTRPGHIFNLGHGILPETPVDHVKAVVQMVREFRP